MSRTEKLIKWEIRLKIQQPVNIEIGKGELQTGEIFIPSVQY
jgi:hypothetical protein